MFPEPQYHSLQKTQLYKRVYAFFAIVSFFFFFGLFLLIGIHSMQGWTATTGWPLNFFKECKNNSRTFQEHLVTFQ